MRSARRARQARNRDRRKDGRRTSTPTKPSTFSHNTPNGRVPSAERIAAEPNTTTRCTIHRKQTTKIMLENVFLCVCSCVCLSVLCVCARVFIFGSLRPGPFYLYRVALRFSLAASIRWPVGHVIRLCSPCFVSMSNCLVACCQPSRYPTTMPTISTLCECAQSHSARLFFVFSEWCLCWVCMCKKRS